MARHRICPACLRHLRGDDEPGGYGGTLPSGREESGPGGLGATARELVGSLLDVRPGAPAQGPRPSAGARFLEGKETEVVLTTFLVYF